MTQGSLHLNAVAEGIPMEKRCCWKSLSKGLMHRSRRGSDWMLLRSYGIWLWDSLIHKTQKDGHCFYQNSNQS